MSWRNWFRRDCFECGEYHHWSSHLPPGRRLKFVTRWLRFWYPLFGWRDVIGTERRRFEEFLESQSRRPVVRVSKSYSEFTDEDWRRWDMDVAVACALEGGDE